MNKSKRGWRRSVMLGLIAGFLVGMLWWTGLMIVLPLTGPSRAENQQNGGLHWQARTRVVLCNGRAEQAWGHSTLHPGQRPAQLGKVAKYFALMASRFASLHAAFRTPCRKNDEQLWITRACWSRVSSGNMGRARTWRQASSLAGKSPTL